MNLQRADLCVLLLEGWCSCRGKVSAPAALSVCSWQGNLPVLPDPLPASFPPHPPILLSGGSVGLCHVGSSPPLPGAACASPSQTLGQARWFPSHGQQRHVLRVPAARPTQRWGVPGHSACTLCPSHLALRELQEQTSHRPCGQHAIAVLWLLPCHQQHMQMVPTGVPWLAGVPPSQPATGRLQGWGSLILSPASLKACWHGQLGHFLKTAASLISLLSDYLTLWLRVPAI